MSRIHQADVQGCWGRIGVMGDRSCPELAEYNHCHNCPIYSSSGRSLLNRELPQDYIEEAGRFIEFEKGSTVQKPSSVVVFRLGHEKLAISAQAFHQVYESQPFHRIPHMRSPGVLGLANLAGEIQLCVSLAQILGITQDRCDGMKTSRSIYSRIAVIVQQDQRWAFPADEILGVHRYSSTLIQAPPSTVAKSSKPFTTGLINYHGDIVGLLDESKLFEALKRSVY